MNRDDNLDRAVRLLDPADRHLDADSARTRSVLHAILATEPQERAQTPRRRSPALPGTRAGGQRPFFGTGRRLALLGGVTGLAAAVIVVAPALTGGDKAFATWRATPSGMSAQHQDEAVEACRDQQLAGAGSEFADSLRNASMAIAERRGTWTTVLLDGADGFAALCITDESGPLFGDGWVGSVGFADVATPTAQDVVATDLGVGTVNGDISMIAGKAGADVVGVTYTSRTHGAVVATVSHGHFALWFPGDELGAVSGGVDVDVTFGDGTSRTVHLSL